MVLNEPRRWGSEAQATHCREGEAGYNVSLEGTMGGTPRPQTIKTEIQGIANKGACEFSRTMDLQPQGGPPILVNESSLLKIRMLAEREPNLIFTSLAYRIDFYLLKKCFRKVRRSRSAGVDKITAKEYVFLAELNEWLSQKLSHEKKNGEQIN